MATTINAYSVSLAMDASSYINASKLSRSETAALKRDIAAARTPTEQFYQTYEKLEKAFQSGAIKLDVYQRLLNTAREKEQKAVQAVEAHNQALEAKRRKLEAAAQAARTETAATVQQQNAAASLGMHLKSLLATYVSLRTVNASVRLAVEAEQAAVQFEVLTGSVEAANRIIADSRKIAASSPLSLVGTQQAYRTLLSFGVAAGQTTEIIGRLSDVTGGNEERFKMLTLAYAQASAAGRLQGQDLLQMINAGFNPLQEISRRTGESLTELRKRMEDGAISSQEMAQAFIDATSEGGRFDGMTARLADTMGGRLAQAMSKLQEAGIDLGKALEPIVTTLTSGFEENNGLLADAVWLVSKFADGIALTLAYTRDLASVTAKVMQGDFLGAALDRGTLPAVNDLLDRLEKRDQERQNALSGAANEDPFASEKLKQDAQLRLELERGINGQVDETKTAYSLAAKGATELFNGLVKVGELEKQNAKLRRQSYEQALTSARRLFEEERRHKQKMRDDIAKTGAGAGFEIGSAEAAKFMADQTNQRIAGMVAIEQPQQTEEELLEEAKKQVAIANELKAKQDRMLALMERQVAAAEQNGFKRIR